MIFSWNAVHVALPIRFAGTWGQYSGSAISQLTRITFHRSTCLYFRCPYHAAVMKTLLATRSATVAMDSLGKSNQGGAKRAGKIGMHVGVAGLSHDARNHALGGEE